MVKQCRRWLFLSWNATKKRLTRAFSCMHSTLLLPGSAVVIIRSPGTDVAVIGCSFASQIPAQALLHTGTEERASVKIH